MSFQAIPSLTLQTPSSPTPKAFSSAPVCCPSIQSSGSEKILTPGLQPSSLLLSSCVVSDFSIHLGEPQTPWLLSFYLLHPSDHSLLSTTASHSHDHSPHIVITRNCAPSKNVHAKQISPSWITTSCSQLILFLSPFYNPLATCRPIHCPAAFSLFTGSLSLFSCY